MSNIEMVDHIKIPKSRIGVLIGKNGKTKAIIEKETTSKIDIDSEDGTVTIQASGRTKDPTLIWKARDIVQAIGRGFSEERAFPLLDDDYYLEMLTLNGSPKTIKRLKGRIIGQKGFTRRQIEENTKCFISVSGKTVAMIGELDNLKVCTKAVDMLIIGDPHQKVYKMLEDYRLHQKATAPTLWRKTY